MTAEVLRDELTVSPARGALMGRMTALVAVVVIVSMALRVPQAALSAYLVFFFAKEDVPSTLRAGLGGIAGVTVAVALTLVIYSISFSEPALRLLLMAVLTFAGMYLFRISPVGPLGLVIGFICTYGITFTDHARRPEPVVRQFLWLWIAVVYPIVLVILSEATFGKRREAVFRDGLGERLRAVAAFLSAPPDADERLRAELARLARAGIDDLVVAANHGPAAAVPLRTALARESQWLVSLVARSPEEWKRDPAVRSELGLAAEHVRGDGTPASRNESPRNPALIPLFSAVAGVALAVEQLRHPPAIETPAPKPAPGGPEKRTDAMRFAIKVTMSVLLAYVIYTATDYPGIHTALITCFFVAQDSVGATVRKLSLRIAGAVIGGSLGMAALVFVLPHLESAGGLAICVAAVTLFATWIATGTERIAYAGLQIALAFYLTVLQGFSRTSHLAAARDRMIGVVLGNVIITVVFTTLWPEKIEPLLRAALARSYAALASLLLGRSDRQGLEATAQSELSAARKYLELARLEPGEHVPPELVAAGESMLIPIHAIAHDRASETETAGARVAIGAWLEGISKAVAARSSLPVFRPPPGPDDSRLKLIRQQAARLGAGT